MSLAAVSTSEHNWRLIERVRHEGSPDTELVAPQSVPFKLNNKLAAAHFLTEMLNEIPSQCGQAQYALVGTLWSVTPCLARVCRCTTLTYHLARLF